MVTDDELVVRQDSDMSRHDSIKSHNFIQGAICAVYFLCTGRRCEIDLQAFNLRQVPEATLKVV